MSFYNPYQPQQMYAQTVPDYMSQTRQQYQPQQINAGLLWVQGEEGAKAYMVAPGNTVLLLDSEGSAFYIKSCDKSGMPSLRVFDYVERTMARSTAVKGSEEFVTRKEFEELVRRLAGRKEIEENA